jgi:hypothetical protein
MNNESLIIFTFIEISINGLSNFSKALVEINRGEDCGKTSIKDRRNKLATSLSIGSISIFKIIQQSHIQHTHISHIDL